MLRSGARLYSRGNSTSKAALFSRTAFWWVNTMSLEGQGKRVCSRIMQSWDFSVVQWLRLHVLNAGGLGSISGQGTRFRMLQLRVHMPQRKHCDSRSHMLQQRSEIPCATAKTRHSQINKTFFKEKEEMTHPPLMDVLYNLKVHPLEMLETLTFPESKV